MFNINVYNCSITRNEFIILSFKNKYYKYVIFSPQMIYICLQIYYSAMLYNSNNI